MSYTLGEAAKAVGFSKPTLSRAIKSGKLSARRLDDGSYSVDASELERWKDANGHRNRDDWHGMNNSCRSDKGIPVAAGVRNMQSRSGKVFGDPTSKV